jgi:hypothetical protein
MKSGFEDMLKAYTSIKVWLIDFAIAVLESDDGRNCGSGIRTPLNGRKKLGGAFCARAAAAAAIRSRRRPLDLLPAAVPAGSKLTGFPVPAAARGIVLGDPVIASFLELLLQRQVGDPMSLITRPVDPHRVIERRQEHLLRLPARALQRPRQLRHGVTP